MDGRDLWNERAALGNTAGTRDRIAKVLEIEAINSYVRDGMRILDAGCGNGETALEIARRHIIEMRGIDFAEAMIAAAWQNQTEAVGLKGACDFKMGDVLDPASLGVGYDLIYTERTIINLPNWMAQHHAIANLLHALAPGGQLVLCENSHEGLAYVNMLRATVGLPAILSPVHNRYLRDEEIEELDTGAYALIEEREYSGTYYLLSRVVNAYLAWREKRELAYDSEINKMALKLPILGLRGQGKIWVFERAL